MNYQFYFEKTSIGLTKNNVIWKFSIAANNEYDYSRIC